MKSYGFWFKAKHSGDFNLFVKTSGMPLLPSRNETRITVPGRPGNLVFDGGPNNKVLSLDLTFAGDFSSRRSVMREIAAWLSGTGPLKMDYEPNIEYKVISVSNNIMAAMEVSFDKFTVDFECEPYQTGKYQGYYVPPSTPTFLENNGTAPAETSISVMAFGEVEILLDGQRCMLSDMDETAYIESGPMIVVNREFENIIHKHSGDFIKIPPGGGEILIIGALGDTRIYYWETWL